MISKLAWSQSFARPGDNLWATYQSSGNATATFSIVNAAGVRVRDLGDNVPVGPGTGTVDWEGYGDGASPLPDGVYRLVLDSVDSNGNRSSVSAQITLDTGAPTIRFLGPAPMRPSSRLVFEVADGLSGVRFATVAIRQRIVARLPQGVTRYAYRPGRGWRPHTAYMVTFYVQDRAGNGTYLTRRFTVPSRHR